MAQPISRSARDETAVAEACSTTGLSPSEFAQLHERAVAAKATAYCPYSNFHVGATLLAKTGGAYVSGANVENASYPVGMCAERVALGKAVVDGMRGFKAIAVATDVAPPASPCGMCRQAIREFCDLDLPVIMFDKDDKFVIMRLAET